MPEAHMARLTHSQFEHPDVLSFGYGRDGVPEVSTGFAPEHWEKGDGQSLVDAMARHFGPGFTWRVLLAG
jgi:hypothetical protein